jgi:hypothetical protein
METQQRLQGADMWDVIREEVLRQEDIIPEDAVASYDLSEDTNNIFRREWRVRGEKHLGRCVEDEDLVGVLIW